MKPSEVPLNQIYLSHHSGSDVTWSELLEITNIGFSQNRKAIKVRVVTKSGSTIAYWRSVEDYDLKFNVFDMVGY